MIPTIILLVFLQEFGIVPEIAQKSLSSWHLVMVVFSLHIGSKDSQMEHSNALFMA